MRPYLKFLVLFSLLFINGCSKDDDPVIEEPENQVTISSTVTSLKDAEISKITVENFELTQNIYNATFGQTDITLSKTSNTELTFLVPPNIETGSYTLDVGFSSNTLDFNITKTQLQETPENVILDFVGNFEVDIDNTIALFDQGNIPPQLLDAKDDINQAIASLNALSDEDKIIAAKFISNNTADLKALEAELSQESILYLGKSQNKKCVNVRCYLAYGAKVLLAAALVEAGGTVAIIGAVVVGIDAIISLIRGKKSVLLSKAIKVVSEAINIVVFWRSELIEFIFDEADKVIFNKSGQKQTNEISNETALTFKIKPSKRTLNEDDINSSDEIVSNFVAAYNKFKNFWNTNFANRLGAFPSFNNNEEQVFAEDLSQFNLAIASNSENVEVSDISGTVEAFTATFTNKTDVEQDFTLDVIFNADDVEAKTSIGFTIGFDEIFLAKVSGDNQTGTQDEALDEPIVVKVTDKDGNAIKDVDVEFVVTEGEGTVSASSIKTNDDGLAQVSWTLGDNLDNQKLEVSVKDSEGNDIETSPLTFTATSEELILSLEKISGDSQSGNENEQLENPLVVKVTDEDGKGIEGIIVAFNITVGNGSLSNSTVTTDSNGLAQVNWTLGNDETSKKVEAVVNDKDGNNIEGSPVTFSAILNFDLTGTWNHINLDTTTRYAEGDECNGTYNTFVSDKSSKFIFSDNNVGSEIYVRIYYEYLSAVCTPSGWNLGSETQREETKGSGFEWYLNGNTLTTIYDNGTDSYDLPIQFIDKDNVAITTEDGDTILLERE